MRASGQKKGSRMTGTFLFSTEITGGGMGYAIVLYFNPVTEHAVFSLAEQIAGRGISSKFLEYQMRPHITLACCSNVDETQCVQLLEGFTKKHTKNRYALVRWVCFRVQRLCSYRRLRRRNCMPSSRNCMKRCSCSAQPAGSGIVLTGGCRIARCPDWGGY